jgi:hypothetical protein
MTLKLGRVKKTDVGMMNPVSGRIFGLLIFALKSQTPTQRSAALFPPLKRITPPPQFHFSHAVRVTFGGALGDGAAPRFKRSLSSLERYDVQAPTWVMDYVVPSLSLQVPVPTPPCFKKICFLEWQRNVYYLLLLE